MRLTVPKTIKGSPNQDFYVEFVVKEGKFGGEYKEVCVCTEFSAHFHLYCRVELGRNGRAKIEDAHKPIGESSPITRKIIELAERESRSLEMLRMRRHVLFVEYSYLYSFSVEYYSETKKRGSIVSGLQPLLLI